MQLESAQQAMFRCFSNVASSYPAHSSLQPELITVSCTFTIQLIWHCIHISMW